MGNRIKSKLDNIKGKRGFTIIELIVVVAIIGILVGIASPRLSGYIDKAKVATIKSEIKTLEFFADELLLNEELPESWRDSGTLPLGKTYGKEGLIVQSADLKSGPYKIVDISSLSEKSLRTKLPGYFVSNKDGNVYYIREELTSKAGNRTTKYDSFQFYYLWMNDVNIEFLKDFQMVILEPRNSNRQQDYLTQLRDNGTEIFAYQSIMGVDNPDNIRQLTDDDYISIDGSNPYQPEFGYKYGDIRSENYRNVLLETLERDVISQGYDGVFLDTLDDVNQGAFVNNVNPKTGRVIRDELVEGYVEFLRIVKEKHPGLSIIQNRGFEVYLAGGDKYIDTLMFENLRIEDYENPMLKRWLFDILVEKSESSNTIIIAVSYENPEENYEVAKELNWTYTYNNRANLENGFKTREKVYRSKYRFIK